MPTTTRQGWSLSATAKQQAVGLINDTRDAIRRHGVNAKILHCFFAAPDGDGSGWAWWIVGPSGDVRPASAELLDAVTGNRQSSIFGWWVSRFIVDGPRNAYGAARVIIGELTIDSPIPGYATGPNGDLRAYVRLIAGETPSFIAWPLDAADGVPAGWPT